jgi:hypothetical protein
MPMQTAKAFFVVTAGVIPGIDMSEHTKQWGYTSEDFEADRNTPADQPTIFSSRLKEAHDYAMGLSNPAYLNWVKVEWLWV